MIALFIELLAPSKILSKCFQDEEIDAVGNAILLKRAKSQLRFLEEKSFQDLPTVKRIIGKVSFVDGKYMFQDIALKNYERALLSAEKTKKDLTVAVKEAIEIRLEDSMNTMSSKIINTDGWLAAKDDSTLFDEDIVKVYDDFEVPLGRAGFDRSTNELLEQWHSILDYTVTYLNPGIVDYRIIWRQLFSSSRSGDWNLVLLIAELLFCLPISNAKVERLFSFMNRVKTDSRASLGENRLNSLLRIGIEGPKPEAYDVTNAMHLWANATIRRPNQQHRKGYKEREKKKNQKH